MLLNAMCLAERNTYKRKKLTDADDGDLSEWRGNEKQSNLPKLAI